MKNFLNKYKSSYTSVAMIVLSGIILCGDIVSNKPFDSALLLLLVCFRWYIAEKHLEIIKEGKITDFLNEDIKG